MMGMGQIGLRKNHKLFNTDLRNQVEQLLYLISLPCMEKLMIFFLMKFYHCFSGGNEI